MTDVGNFVTHIELSFFERFYLMMATLIPYKTPLHASLLFYDTRYNTSDPHRHKQSISGITILIHVNHPSLIIYHIQSSLFAPTIQNKNKEKKKEK